MENPARFKVIVWHRKAHKTTLAINELIRKAALKKGVYWYIAPFSKQAKEIVWQDPEMLPKYCPPLIWERRNNSEHYIPFPNGSILFIKGADDPDALRGPNPFGTVLDEYGDMKADVWKAVLQPITTANPNAWVWFMGTPKGKNDFFEKYQFAKNGESKDWSYSILKASQTGLMQKESLEDAKRTTTEAFYKQEYECDFLDDASGVFKNFDTQIWSGDLKPEDRKQYQIGADLAKYNDFTVLTPIDLHTWKVGTPDRFNQIDWVLQKTRIEAFWRKYNKGLVRLDSTGLGDPIYDDLEKQEVSLESFKFNQQTREALLNNLVVLLENRQIFIPNFEPLLDELRSMKYDLKSSPGGRTRITMTVPEGLHDDCIMSLGLACWNLRERLPLSTTFNRSLEFQDAFGNNDYDDRYGIPMRND